VFVLRSRIPALTVSQSDEAENLCFEARHKQVYYTSQFHRVATTSHDRYDLCNIHMKTTYSETQDFEFTQAVISRLGHSL
jgi:hypothetical protein